jgi:hypothetical protein
MRYLGPDVRVILKWVSDKESCERWTSLMWLRMGSVVGCCEQGNKLHIVSSGEFLDWQSDY